MIDLYFWPTPNGFKVTIMLEECGLPYRVHAVDIGAGDQFKPEFLRIGPNNRMPVIIDQDPLGGGKPLAIFESGAILEYLADKTGRFLPKTPAERYKVLQWAYWQMANLGPMMGNANHFKHLAKNIADDPGQLVYATKRFVGEVDRLCGVLDAHLSVNQYLAGEYSIADMLSWPWARLVPQRIDDDAWTRFPNMKRWVEQVGARPAVQKGAEVHKAWAERKLTPEEAKARRELLFNQTNDKVRQAREEAARRAVS